MCYQFKFGSSVTKGVGPMHKFEGSPRKWVAMGHRPHAVVAWLSPRNTPLPRMCLCYPAEFGCSGLIGRPTGVIKEIRLKNLTPLAFQGHSRSSETTRTDPPPMTSHQRSVATMGLSCTVSEINGDYSPCSQIFPTVGVFDAPADGVPLGILYRRRGLRKPE